MGYLKYMREAWKNNSYPELNRARLIAWRKGDATVRIDRPTRIDRARAIGYRAKQGFILVRQRIMRGGRMRPRPVGGRRPKAARQYFVLDTNYQVVAEQRAGDKYPNCEVLGSYYLNQDGKNYWYEVVLVDKAHPVILADPRISWIAQPQHKGRVYRGLTAASRVSRGLRWKGTGTEKLRPSKAAVFRRKVHSWNSNARTRTKANR
ncbi:MAG TPA: 50S ribosomal protein L15e [Candidatus Nanoarchaeia archaeon]|nr:50S ribosomal protein L15e [Candidatus Nanoarchaeia archaeon]